MRRVGATVRVCAEDPRRDHMEAPRRADLLVPMLAVFLGWLRLETHS